MRNALCLGAVQGCLMMCTCCGLGTGWFCSPLQAAGLTEIQPTVLHFYQSVRRCGLLPCSALHSNRCCCCLVVMVRVCLKSGDSSNHHADGDPCSYF